VEESEGREKQNVKCLALHIPWDPTGSGPEVSVSWRASVTFRGIRIGIQRDPHL